jgi:hypothetical protein
LQIAQIRSLAPRFVKAVGNPCDLNLINCHNPST